MYRYLPYMMFLFLLPKGLAGQDKAGLKELFIEAEDHFLYREYEDAVQLYPILDDGTNHNIFYKIGLCYLNIPNEKSKAISYLERAVEKASQDARDDQFTENRAPLDAYFYLANAYRINNQIDRALETYNLFKSKLGSNISMANLEFVNQAISTCETARELQKKPVSYIPVNLGENINLVSINKNPAISGNEEMLAFTAKFGEDDVVFFSQYGRSGWEVATDITRQLGSGRDVSTCALSFDGREMFLYKVDDQDGNIYRSLLGDDGIWSRIEKLNRNINTRYYESHACISADGSTLYFASNRKGGEGELDIYYSVKDKSGDWGPAINLGPVINSAFNETTPFITGNDSILYFSSEGHYNMGGYDIFYSRKQADGSWSKPVNVGYPVNTTDDNLFFNPVENGESAYFTMEDGYKEINIYRLKILPPGVTRNFEIKGIVSLEDTVVEFNQDYRITLTDRETGKVLDMGVPNRQTGQYLFVVKSGEYGIRFEGKGYTAAERELSVDEYAKNSEFIIHIRLSPLAVRPVVPNSLRFTPDARRLRDARPLDDRLVIKDLLVEDLETETADREVLYYTVQLMALRVTPVDVSYFSPLKNVEVLLGKDGFYRYTFGRFRSQEEAESARQQLIRAGYPDVWIKKVYSENPSQK